jgi:hypothetical protein
MSASVVRLFGRVIEGVTIDKKKLADSMSGGNKLQLDKEKGDVWLARIYAFSFEGRFFTLPKPTLFLVEGVGADAETDTGLAEISNVRFEAGIKRWMSDKDEMALRADIVIGAVDEILIDAALSPTAKYPIISRAGTPQEASWRDGQMIARNRLQ